MLYQKLLVVYLKFKSNYFFGWIPATLVKEGFAWMRQSQASEVAPGGQGLPDSYPLGLRQAVESTQFPRSGLLNAHDSDISGINLNLVSFIKKQNQ